ncbi:TonB family protein [Sphingomonas sp. Leaf4]|uniref:TonB family protein n=1 Tax=Sphingomonas sp. Leaf4 TaxID=2876553 RepID=UPI001E5C981F|nr:TonB family protein [Sphingomonas sp. Leaf4]
MTAALALFFATAAPLAPVMADPPRQQLLRWQVDPIRCGARRVTPLAPIRPLSGLVWGKADPQAITFTFRIDATGRALSIAQTPKRYAPSSEDLGPALAAARFTPGETLADCAVTYHAEAVPFARADPVELMAYTLDPISGRLPREGWDRIMPPGSDCLRPPYSKPLLTAFPDYDRIPGTPGERSWSMTGYDLTAKGRPVNVRTVAGTANAPLDAAARKAVAASRFTAGARTGCLLPHSRAATPLPAPVAPEEASFGAKPNCPAAPWAQPPRLTYPRPWNRRSIEGWAVVTYDVAPWGEVGNVRVLASEPAEAFGEQAMQVVRSARRAPSPTGASGCIDRVMFKIRPTNEPADAEAVE